MRIRSLFVLVTAVSLAGQAYPLHAQGKTSDRPAEALDQFEAKGRSA